MIPKIIFQDSSILVLSKPAGWITNSASTTKNQPVVQDWLKQEKLTSFSDYSFRDGIVHRLDKETSGLLLVAKTEDAFEELQRQFKDRLVKKMYTALVHGKVASEIGEIKAAVGRLPWRRDRFGVLPGGREASTKYKVLSNYKLPTSKNLQLHDYSLVEFYPETGRTHQIRIHAKHIGHPLVADEFYAGRKTARNDRKWCPRLFLHASGIQFLHPISGKSINLKSELPDDLKNVLNSLTLL